MLTSKITEVCQAFYNLDFLNKNDHEESKMSDKKITMSSTALDEHDKIKEMWAFNLPCMLLVNKGRDFWV